MTRKESYTGPWPRKRHSHTCVTCKRGRDQGAVYCYKSRCALPQQTESCECCRSLQPSATYRPPAPAAARPEVQEVAQWYTLIDEGRRVAIFSALSESQRKVAFQYGAAVAWRLLPQYARDLVTTEWWNGRRPWNVPADVRSHLPACGFLKSGKDQTACQCSQLRLAAAIDMESAVLAPILAVDDICSLCGTLPCSCPPEPADCGAVIDVCIAGNPAENGICGEPDCVCCPRPAAALEDDGGRTREGNTPTCEDCGESQDHCSCEPAQLDLFGGAR